ncbi:MAG TPA: FliA/WhiG family RNA polymerase sigma factor [Candidatus Pseudogracilibacillus intestinigallinarum]|uniref:FliA/WhiG family RNA polymerase sigma factor n=1 Tax=Candidatus Pseudogracilibacillus intestinigallinarum TaxID=2838742 RepID=A0A9D1PPC4_9BACI|nr:FliA/WhiG family RNA polymerase sigma factor [Candidatus Pseudogracilibacillus intestinigallinarum]
MEVKNSQYIHDLWQRWTANKENDVADALITHYMYLVQYHVDRISSTLPDNFEKNEIKSLGLIGLYDALHKFDISRQLKFDTYATIRIRGAIMDGLRKEDWLPRGLREQTKRVEKVAEILEQQLHHTPTPSEISAELQMPVEEVEDILQHALLSNVISMDQTVVSNNQEEKVSLGAMIEDETLHSPDEELLKEELKAQLMESVQQLNENEQLVISLFYEEELTLTEIGEVLQLTTSRISQIHKRAILKLRNIIQKIA